MHLLNTYGHLFVDSVTAAQIDYIVQLDEHEDK